MAKANPEREELTPEEKEALLARVRAQGRSLTDEEQAAILGPPVEKVEHFRQAAEVVEEMEPASLDSPAITRLEHNFFPELGGIGKRADERLIRGVIFDFDDTLAHLTRPLDDLMAEGAKAAEAYMRTTGMELTEGFWTNIVEARRFAEEKSEEEKEEHLADDAMSFLLQFFGYPTSRMDPQVLKHAVDLFYAPEMSSWKLRPGALRAIKSLHDAGYKLAVLANYNNERAFQRTIDYLGIRPYLDLCVASASVEVRKPDAKFFNLALERWDALPYEVVVVGDSLLHDIQGGIEVGCLTIQAHLGSTAQVEFNNQQLAGQIKADATIDNFDQLSTLIQQWAEN